MRRVLTITMPGRIGSTAIQTILAFAMVSVAAYISMTQIRFAPANGEQRECDLIRHRHQRAADQWFSTEGSWPSRDLRELKNTNTPANQFVCPTSGNEYQMSGAVVLCPEHEATRKH